jgi:isopentenyldiphosphate isomerase
MTDHLLAQDPDELFDVVRGDGVPLGFSKARAAVHRDGDWHRALHVWVAGIDADDGLFLLCQRRGLGKDTWPGRLDATVGGHLRAGETIEDALRECEEEIGVAVSLADLRLLGNRRGVGESEPGIRDRELQAVYLLRDDRPLTDYRPSPAELAAVVRLPLPALLDFLAGDFPVLTATQLTPTSPLPEAVEITAADFVPTFDRYFYRVAIAVEGVLRGARHVAV